MNRILIVNVNWLGDVVFSTPIFKALKAAYPNAKISCLGVPRVREVLENSPCVDEIIIYDEEGRHRFPWAKLRLIWELRRRKFDAAFILHRSWTRAAFVFLAGIPVRVGYNTKGRGSLLTHKISEPRELVHRSDYYLRIIEAFGVKVKDRICELKNFEQANYEPLALLTDFGISSEDFVVVVHVSGNWDLKRWPKQSFALLIRRLVRDFHAKVIIPGAAKEEDLVREISQLSEVDPIVLVGKTNFKQLMGLMHRANLVVSSDSGPLHVAVGVGTDAVAIFGPTRPEVTGPRGKGRSFVLQHDVGCNRGPCYHLTCYDNVCMQAITVEDVCEKIRQIRN